MTLNVEESENITYILRLQLSIDIDMMLAAQNQPK